MTLLTRRFLRIGAVSGAALLAAACAETQLGAQAVKEVARSGGDAPAQPGPELAPEAFDATGLTIWDGASTLEGVWVAHPLAQRAQRVRVTNAENEIAVEGAMFRRDPTLSGPSILVSSDAARLLGLQPGVPTELRIVALREGIYAAPSTSDTAAVAETSAATDANAVETAALAAPAPQVSDEADDVAETGEAPEVVEQTEVAAVEAPQPVDEQAAAQSTAQAEPAAAETPPTQPVAAQPAPEQPATRPKSAITAADLRGETNVAAVTPQPSPEPATAAASPEAPTPAPKPTPAPAAPQPASQTAPTPVVSGDASGPFKGALPKGRFVQAGAFGVEPNAAALVDTLRGAGLPAQYVQRDVNGSALNIVMIGPLANDAAADAAIAAAGKAGAPGARKVIR